jgi:hypothetical protein
MATRKTNRKVRQTTKATIPAPVYEVTPWPVQITRQIDDLFRRVAQLEADRDELKATVLLSAAAKTLKGGQP